MSGKRRDNKNRILRNGESQRKDGRYAFKYIDASGQVQLVKKYVLQKTGVRHNTEAGVSNGG